VAPAQPVVVPPPAVNPPPASAVTIPTPPPVTTPPPAVSPAPAAPQTVVAPPPTNTLATNPVEQVQNTEPTIATVTNPALSSKTNSVPVSAPAPDSNNKLLIGIGIGLLIAACILGAVLVTRSRRSHGSLISDSMREK
jgi:hypothetical protein